MKRNALAALLLLAGHANAADETLLVERGVSRAEIVVAEERPRMVTLAMRTAEIDTMLSDQSVLLAPATEAAAVLAAAGDVQQTARGEGLIHRGELS